MKSLEIVLGKAGANFRTLLQTNLQDILLIRGKNNFLLPPQAVVLFFASKAKASNITGVHGYSQCTWVNLLLSLKSIRMFSFTVFSYQHTEGSLRPLMPCLLETITTSPLGHSWRGKIQMKQEKTLNKELILVVSLCVCIYIKVIIRKGKNYKLFL